MQLVTPNQRGHHPEGTPVSTDGSYAASSGSDDALNEYSDTPDLEAMKEALREVQQDASTYLRWTKDCREWWNCQWPGQTVDGRKNFSDDGNPDSIFPWPGASDTRPRLIKTAIDDYRTIGTYALMNMKLQARSTRPTVQGHDSGVASTLLNWQLFNQMQPEWHRESKYNLALRNGQGAAVARVAWIQKRRIDFVEINVQQFGLWVQMATKSSALQPQDIQEMLVSKEYQKDMLQLIQAMSPIVDTGKAREILNALRRGESAKVPIPYVFKSQPQITTLQPMVDVFFPIDTCDLQLARFVDEIERVTEPDLYDRIETENYDEAFVKAACERKGDSTGQLSVEQAAGNRNYFGKNSWRDARARQHMITLHHFWHISYDMGTPVLCKTIFHEDVETPAVHGPTEYEHGEMPYHDMRFEHDDRPILSSRGLAEILYTAQQEYKVQLDARTDWTSFASAPPLFSDHPDIGKLKKAFMPKTIIPMRRGSEPRFAVPPQYNPGWIEITQNIERRIENILGVFGLELDPQKKQMRQMELVDDILSEWKPVFAQLFQLDQQLLPEADVQDIVGPLSRPFHMTRSQIQGKHEIIATVDLRDLDKDWNTSKAQGVASIAQFDNAGIIDRNPIIKGLLAGIDYNWADQAVQTNDQAAEKEKTDEIQTLNRIIGSGMPEPLPMGGNYQLRLQTAQQHLQQGDPKFPNPNFQRPDVQAVLQNRFQFFQRQIQQQQNAQIGRAQVPSPFGNQAPTVTNGAAPQA
jgi:hypothetical protein